MKQITEIEKIKYLDSRGGRTLSDVEKDRKGEYVWMTNGYKQVKVYLPYIKK